MKSFLCCLASWAFLFALSASGVSAVAKRPILTRKLEEDFTALALEYIREHSEELGLDLEDIEEIEPTGIAPGLYEHDDGNDEDEEESSSGSISSSTSASSVSAASASASEDGANRFLRGGNNNSTRRQRRKNRSTSHVYVVQKFKGIPITNARATVVILGDTVKKVNSRFRRNLRKCATLPSDRVLSAEQAVETAAHHFEAIANLENVTFPVELKEGPSSDDRTKFTVFYNQTGLSRVDIEAHLAYYFMESEQCDVRLTWNIKLAINDQNFMEVWVDASAVQGGVIQMNNWVRGGTFSALALPREAPCVECSRNEWLQLFANDIPVDVLVDPEDPVSSPLGWLTANSTTYTYSRGNNAFAMAEEDGLKNEVYEVQATGPGDVFDYSGFGFYEAAWESRKNPAILNAFYVVNSIHDVMYHYGFDEASGNFQEDNFGKGGHGGDPMWVEVDYKLTNNANAFSPPDGIAPLIQLYPFDRALSGEISQVDRKFTIGSLVFDRKGTDYELPNDWGSRFAWGVYNAEIILSETPGNSGCEDPDDNAYNRKIVIMRQGGGCPFATKALYAQNRGAHGVVIVGNNDRLREMGANGAQAEADAPLVTIPVVRLKNSDGVNVIAAAQNGERAELISEPSFVHSAFDNTIIAHEWCHAMANRLLGGSDTSSCTMSTLEGNIADGMEEGWCDFFGLFFTSDSATAVERTVGSYVVLNDAGLRRTPYSPDMSVDGALYGPAVRTNGLYENGWIWCSILWDMYCALIEQEGFNSNLSEAGDGGNNMAMELMVEGMKAIACLPTYVSARDGILDTYETLYPQGTYTCLLWGIFARRGLGSQATASPAQASFDLPPQCSNYQLPEVFWPHPTENPTGGPTGGPTGQPTGNPTESPTGQPTAGPTGQPTSAPSNQQDTSATDCSKDVVFVGEVGETPFPSDSIAIIGRSETTVTFKFEQNWNEDLDHLWIQYPDQSTGDETCFQENHVTPGQTFEYTAQCSHFSHIAIIDVFVADGGGILSPSDDATIPTCCHPQVAEAKPKAQFTLKIYCKKPQCD